jgi:hypothetical protein
MTNVVWPSQLTGMNLCVLNRNTIYCSIISANCIESTKVIKLKKKINWMKKHLHDDWSQIPVKCTSTKPTAWLQTTIKRRLRQTPPKPRLLFLLTVLPQSQTNSKFSASHERRSCIVKRDGHWLLGVDWIQTVSIFEGHTEKKTKEFSTSIDKMNYYDRIKKSVDTLNALIWVELYLNYCRCQHNVGGLRDVLIAYQDILYVHILCNRKWVWTHMCFKQCVQVYWNCELRIQTYCTY